MAAHKNYLFVSKNNIGRWRGDWIEKAGSSCIYILADIEDPQTGRSKKLSAEDVFKLTKLELLQFDGIYMYMSSHPLTEGDDHFPLTLDAMRLLKDHERVVILSSSSEEEVEAILERLGFERPSIISEVELGGIEAMGSLVVHTLRV